MYVYVCGEQRGPDLVLSHAHKATIPSPSRLPKPITNQVDPASVEPGFFKIKRRVAPPPTGYRSRRPAAHHGGGLRPGPKDGGRPRPGAAAGPQGYHGGDGPGMGARSSSFPYALNGLAADTGSAAGAGCVGCAACEVRKEGAVGMRDDAG